MRKGSFIIGVYPKDDPRFGNRSASPAVQRQQRNQGTSLSLLQISDWGADLVYAELPPTICNVK